MAKNTHPYLTAGYDAEKVAALQESFDDREAAEVAFNVMGTKYRNSEISKAEWDAYVLNFDKVVMPAIAIKEGDAISILSNEPVPEVIP
jgi:hypothetical protein